MPKDELNLIVEEIEIAIKRDEILRFLGYRGKEVKEQVKIGMRVEAKWRDECQGHLFDIEYFKPI